MCAPSASTAAPARTRPVALHPGGQIKCVLTGASIARWATAHLLVADCCCLRDASWPPTLRRANLTNTAVTDDVVGVLCARCHSTLEEVRVRAARPCPEPDPPRDSGACRPPAVMAAAAGSIHGRQVPDGPACVRCARVPQLTLRSCEMLRAPTIIGDALARLDVSGCALLEASALERALANCARMCLLDVRGCALDDGALTGPSLANGLEVLRDPPQHSQ